jgi:ABC-type transport system involved in cytochrome bd biosynthesis fused ATPase/permease subunit
MQCDFVYDSINLHIQRGSLVAMVGTVGAGKSSILAALLGEMRTAHGSISVCGSIAYVPQAAWIMNATLQENIVFGREFSRTLYDQIIRACALKQDLGK